MNREERRAKKIRNKDPAITIKKSQLDKMLFEAEMRGREQACSDAAQEVFTLLLSLPLKVIHEKYGWGKKRLSGLADGLIEEYTAFSEDEITLEEYREWIFEMVGVKFETQEV